MAMTDLERGALLLKQERLQNQIVQHFEYLKQSGEFMQTFGPKLVGDPNKVIFSNAPPVLGSTPSEFMNATAIEWEQAEHALDLMGIAQALQDLRAAKAMLRQVAEQLSRG